MASVVVLDMDDTLFLERDYVLSGFAAVDAVVAKEHGLKGFSECAWRLFCAGLRGRIFDEALKEMGVELQSASVAELVVVYRSHLPQAGAQHAWLANSAWLIARLCRTIPMVLAQPISMRAVSLTLSSGRPRG